MQIHNPSSMTWRHNNLLVNDQLHILMFFAPLFLLSQSSFTFLFMPSPIPLLFDWEDIWTLKFCRFWAEIDIKPNFTLGDIFPVPATNLMETLHIQEQTRADTWKQEEQGSEWKILKGGDQFSPFVYHDSGYEVLTLTTFQLSEP